MEALRGRLSAPDPPTVCGAVLEEPPSFRIAARFRSREIFPSTGQPEPNSLFHSISRGGIRAALTPRRSPGPIRLESMDTTAGAQRAAGISTRRATGEPGSVEKARLPAGPRYSARAREKPFDRGIQIRRARREDVEKEHSPVADLRFPGESTRRTRPGCAPEELGPIDRAARADVEVVQEPPVENLQSIRMNRVRVHVPADLVDGARPESLALRLTQPAVDSDIPAHEQQGKPSRGRCKQRRGDSKAGEGFDTRGSPRPPTRVEGQPRGGAERCGGQRSA